MLQGGIQQDQANHLREQYSTDVSKSINNVAVMPFSLHIPHGLWIFIDYRAFNPCFLGLVFQLVFRCIPVFFDLLLGRYLRVVVQLFRANFASSGSPHLPATLLF